MSDDSFKIPHWRCTRPGDSPKKCSCVVLNAQLATATRVGQTPTLVPLRRGLAVDAFVAKMKNRAGLRTSAEDLLVIALKYYVLTRYGGRETSFKIGEVLAHCIEPKAWDSLLILGRLPTRQVDGVTSLDAWLSEEDDREKFFRGVFAFLVQQDEEHTRDVPGLVRLGKRLIPAP